MGAAALLFAGQAAAQTQPSIDARTWRPSTDPAASVALEPVSTPGPWLWSVGAWVSYAQSPVVLRDGSSGNVVARPVFHAMGADLVAGLGLGARAAVGIDLPFAVWQDGSSGLPATIVTGGGVPTAALGDLALTAKVSILDDARLGMPSGPGIAADARLTLPTGDRTSFGAEGAVTASVRILAEYGFAVGALRASLGYAARTANRTWPDSAMGGVPFGDSIPWSLGAVIRPAALSSKIDNGDRQLWELAVHGSLPAGPILPFGLGDPGASALSPALLTLDDRIAVGHDRDLALIAGIELGLDQAVGVPLVRLLTAVTWSPHPHDRDRDSVPDELDECPDLPEDRDGIQDQDGCPEDDADSDGILDTQDACPLVPGVWWNDPHKNGCPAPDSDGDGISDPADACPALKGARSADPKRNGCPAAAQDRDNDGIPDDADQCPDQPEDRDGYRDFDGCPELDEDGDGIPDAEDACPQERGPRSSDASRNGCPDLDRDADTFDDSVDGCPDQPEVFNGVKDNDGCPDEGAQTLITVKEQDRSVQIETMRPIAFSGPPEAPTVDPSSASTVRAIAQALGRHPAWTLAVAVRPGSGKPEDARRAALERAMVLANRIVVYTHRPSSAEAVSWDVLKAQAAPGRSVALVVLATAVQRPSAPLHEQPDGERR